MVTSETPLPAKRNKYPSELPSTAQSTGLFHSFPPASPLTPASSAIHSLGRYNSRIANTDAELDAACRLRFDVFNTELGHGLIQSYATGQDRDKFDQVCDHLLVEDSEIGAIVGTYRMQSGLTASINFGYYSHQEFDLTPYEAMRPQILELGRACIHPAHRTSEVLTLLWRSIASYCRHHGLRYLIGCSSLTSSNPREGWALYHQLQPFLAASEYQTSVHSDYRLPYSPDAASTHVKVPKLLKTYLATGARICAQPAWDRAFGTIDFLTLLDLEQLSPAARSRFLTRTQ